MSDEQPSEVLGALPRARPHRRSQKRSGAAAAPASRTEPHAGAQSGPARKPIARKPPRAAGPQSRPARPGGPQSRPAGPPATPEPSRPSHGDATEPGPPPAGADDSRESAVTTHTEAADSRRSLKGRATTDTRKPQRNAATAAQGTPEPPPDATTTARGAPHPRPLRQPAQPKGLPTTPRRRHPEPLSGADMFDTAVRATAELAEIGLMLSARAIRRAMARLPRP